MKKSICIVFLFLSLFACNKEDIVVFNQPKDCIQFDYDPLKDEMKLEYDFANQFILVTDEYGYKDEYYLGDSLTRDTISLHLVLMGHALDTDRSFKLKSVSVQSFDSLPESPVEFLPAYVFRAGQLQDTVQIILLRPEKRGKFAVGITFDLEDDNSSFAFGAEEQSVFNFLVSNSYECPEDWDEGEIALGEYSEEKYAFFITILHQKFYAHLDWELYNPLLRRELEKYNAEHPDSPKDFTFPVYTKPIWWDWWDNAGSYLGEFSEAKKEFVIGVIGKENYHSETEWDSFMPKLKEAYDRYNHDHPDSPLPFPPFS